MIRFCSLIGIFILLAPLSALEWFTTTRAGLPGKELETGPKDIDWSLSREESGERVSTSIYLNAELNRKVIIQNSNGHLISREEFNADGELVSHVEYAYDSDGNMRVILFNDKTNGSEPNKIFTTLDNSVDGVASRAIEGAGKEWNITDKNQNGINVREITLKDDIVSEEVVYALDENDRLLEKRVISGDMETRSEFNSDGLLQRETISLKRLVISEKIYEWEDSRLISVEEKSAGSLLRLEKKWDKGKIVKETEWVNDGKKRVTVWSSPKAWTDILYRNNKPVLRIYWENNVRIKEEILNLGSGIKTRE